jgi:hypothetical protein
MTITLWLRPAATFADGKLPLTAKPGQEISQFS